MLRATGDAEGDEQHRGRIDEVGDEHRAPPHHIRERNGRQRPEQPAEIEAIGRLRLPRFAQHSRRLTRDPVLRAYSLPSVPPSSGTNALQAHQVMSAVTAAASPLIVFFLTAG